MRRSIALIAASALLLAGGPTVSAGGSSTAGTPGVQSDASENRAADPTNRWIVVLADGTDVATAADRQGRHNGFRAERTFKHAIRGYAAVLNRSQVAALRRDPTVASVVPDERIETTAQRLPTGISRVNATKSSSASIDGVDDRVDADVAIVDTGIALVPDLNVVGGYNCASSTRTAWRDVYGHGTHVAGTVGALDNGSGVVGVAPGVRLWAVRILNDNGDGLLSWYVCGLDWIAAQRDPNDVSRPLIEAVNMSVAKWGTDDGACGTKNNDILHAAICRLVASGVTVVAAAANDSGSAAARVPAAYNEVITVSALADTDGLPGGLGGHLCYSWGTYDSDDTFANFSNHGSDVDLIAPGKCIWSTVPGGYKYSSGTSMAAPHVTGAVALLKANRPAFTPAEVKEALQYLGSDNWKRSTDPDSTHEKLLDVSRIGPRGDFDVASGPDDAPGEAGGVTYVPVTVTRTSTSFERVRLSATNLPNGFTAATGSVYGFGTRVGTVPVRVPPGTPLGTYRLTIRGDEHGNTHTTSATIRVRSDDPTAKGPTVAGSVGGGLRGSSIPMSVRWPAASDPTTSIVAYQVGVSVNAGSWDALASGGATLRSVGTTEAAGTSYRYRVRASDEPGNWSAWATGPIVTPAIVQDRGGGVTYSGSWQRTSYRYASGGTTTRASSTAARARLSFTGRAVSYVAPIGPTKGSAKVWVDGIYRGTVRLRSAANGNARIRFSATFASSGSHTIEIRPAGNGPIDLDAFVILR